MEESLKRLKKARKSAAAAGMSDDDKIRLQLYLDVQHFGEQVRNVLAKIHAGPHFNVKTIFAGIGIPIIKRRNKIC